MDIQTSFTLDTHLVSTVPDIRPAVEAALKPRASAC
jgi:hypothetical protein